MNIDKIVKECPKAWEEWLGFFIHPYHLGTEEYKYTWNKDNKIIEIWTENYLEYEAHFRELYDYFDSVGIIVSVYYDADANWCYEIVTSDDCIIQLHFDNRIEAEYKGLLCVFEIREQQISTLEIA